MVVMIDLGNKETFKQINLKKMKELLQQIVFLLSELLSHQKNLLIPIPVNSSTDIWIDLRTTMHMTMRSRRQVFRYVEQGHLISKKIGQANVYLESSILNLLGKNDSFYR